MKTTRAILGTVLVLAACVAATTGGCINNNAAPPVGADSSAPLEDTGVPLVDSSAPPDAGLDATISDAGPGVDAADSAVPQAQIRLGWLAAASAAWPTSDAGAPLGLDFCVSPHGAGAWQGPLLASAGLAAGLQPYEVTAYFSVPAGSDDVRILPAGSITCEVGTPWPGDADADGGSLFQTLTSLPPVAAGATITIAISDSLAVDDAGTDGIVALVDETTAAAGMANLRFVNVSQSSQPATFGLGSNTAFSPLFNDVTPYQQIDPTADPAGYRAVPPVSSIDTTLEAAATADWSAASLTTPPVALPAGAVLTTFAIGAPLPPTYAYLLLSCFDGQTLPGTAALSNCVLTTTSPNPQYTMFGNFLADTSQPAADVCIKYHELSSFQGPLLGGPDAGSGGPALNPPTGSGTPSALTAYYPLAPGFSYDVRYVAPGGGCSPGLGADYLYVPPTSSSNATVLATGFLTPPGDAGEPSLYDAGTPDGGPDGGYSPGLPSVAMTWLTLTNEASEETQSVRILNLAAFNPQPLDANGGSWSFQDIPYGGFGTEGSGVVDANGYLLVTGGGGGLELTDTIGGTSVTDLAYSIDSSDEVTFYVFTNGSPTAVGVLSCLDDGQSITGGLAYCTFLNGG